MSRKPTLARWLRDDLGWFPGWIKAKKNKKNWLHYFGPISFDWGSIAAPCGAAAGCTGNKCERSNQSIRRLRVTARRKEKKPRGCKSRPFISVIKGVRRGKVLLRIHVYVQKRRSRMEDAGCRAPSASHRHILTDGLTPSDPFHPSPDIARSTTWPAHWQQRWAITAHALTMRYFVVQTCQSEAVGLLIFRSQICAYIWFFFSSLSHTFRQKKKNWKRQRQGFARSTESNQEKSAESKKLNKSVRCFKRRSGTARLEGFSRRDRSLSKYALCKAFNRFPVGFKSNPIFWFSLPSSSCQVAIRGKL